MIKYVLITTSVIIITIFIFLLCANSSRADLDDLNFKNSTSVSEPAISYRQVEQKLTVRCGQRLDAYSSRIVGGRLTTIEDFP